MKKLNKKGFTLVEIIVVIVIMVILAAIAIPAVLGYIDDAKDAAYLGEGRAILIASNVEATKLSADNNLSDEEIAKKEDTILTMAELDGDIIEMNTSTSAVNHFVYKIKDASKWVIYDTGKEMRVVSEYDLDNKTSGFTVDDSLDAETKKFFTTNWDQKTYTYNQDSVVVNFKKFSAKGKDYVLALSTVKAADNSSLKKEIADKYNISESNVILCYDGSLTTNDCKIITSAIGNNQQIKEITLDDNNHISLEYKK